MSEKEAISMVKQPNTRESIARDLKSLGLERGMTVIVHSSLSSMGWVCGGPVAVVQALMDVIGEDGNLIMPTQSADNSDPSEWSRPAVPEAWWETIRQTMPAYDPIITPTRGMGKIVEAFRTFPDVKRSAHPTCSFAAWGKESEAILSGQILEEGFGKDSPLERIYERNGYVLLIGVTHDSNTSLHYAEHAIEDRERVKKGSAVLEDGKQIWKTFEEIVYDSDPFEELGKDFEAQNKVIIGKIGQASCRLVEQRKIVDYARNWLKVYNQ